MASKEEDREMAGVRYRKELMKEFLPSTRRQLARIEKDLEREERG